MDTDNCGGKRKSLVVTAIKLAELCDTIINSYLKYYFEVCTWNPACVCAVVSYYQDSVRLSGIPALSPLKLTPLCSEI